MSDKYGAQLCLLRGFEEVSYLGVSQRSGAVRQGCKITFLSDVAEGVFVHRHNQ